MASLDSFKCRKTLEVGAKTYQYFSLKAAEKNGLAGIAQLPFSLKVVLENLLRNEDGRSVTKEDIEAVAAWLVNSGKTEHEIAFRPARVLMQDFTGVPAVVDLAAMRDAMAKLGGDPDKINPLVPVDLVIDHSVIVDEFGTAKALSQNVELEYERNHERYRFLKWGQGASPISRSCRPAPASAIRSISNISPRPSGPPKEKPRAARRVEVAYPDTLVGTDSHTTMVNGLAVLGWGVGGIEAEAAMLGQPLSMLLPEVDRLQADRRAARRRHRDRPRAHRHADAAQEGRRRQVRRILRPRPQRMSLADRATIANMAPEYGATCGFFPIDAQDDRLSHRPRGARTRASRWSRHTPRRKGCSAPRLTPDPVFTDTLELDLGEVAPSLAGPKRPQDRVALAERQDGLRRRDGPRNTSRAPR